MSRTERAPDDNLRFLTACQKLQPLGFIVQRQTVDGQTTYFIRRWGRERALRTLDEVAAFTRIAVASEGGPP